MNQKTSHQKLHDSNHQNWRFVHSLVPGSDAKGEERAGVPLRLVLDAEVLGVELCRIWEVPLVHHDAGCRHLGGNSMA